jgi:hypothetical protein
LGKRGNPRLRILEEVARYHELTAEQLSRLLSYTHRFTQLQCQNLAYPKDKTDPIMLQAVRAERPAADTRLGNPPYVYVLAKSGWDHLFAEGYPVRKRFRPSEEIARAGTPHMAAVNDVLINAHLLNTQVPDIQLSSFVHDREFRSDPLRFGVADNAGKRKMRNLRPDLLLDFRIPKDRLRYMFAIELNVTHVDERRWRDVIRRYCFCLPSYEERFGTRTLVVATLIQSRSRFPRPVRPAKWRMTVPELREREVEEAKLQNRLIDLLRWTEKELTNLNLEAEADFFRFSTAPLDLLTPKALFTSAHFVMPFGKSPAPLIPYRSEGNGN